VKVNSDPNFIADCKRNVYSQLPMSGEDYRAYLEGLQTETQSFYDKNPW